SLIFSFPMPILLALSLNEVRSNSFRRTIQTLSYLPHFISTVVVCGIIRIFFDKDGIMTQVLTLFGMPNRNLLVYPQYFRGIYIGTGIWQSMGWSSIIYIAALSGVSPELYEAATIDGAGRFQKMWHVSIPAILPTIVTMFILNCGRLMSVGYEKIMLLYNENTYKTADVISTYVYRYGLGGSFEYSYTTAISIFTSIVNVVLLTCSNFLSNKLSGYGLW
ncbi:MAG: sugar ABC transporter permease, partial [Clostridia bacterium]|nr:sugar ABC transporter permease [Clostridia bacterium]